MTDATIEIAGMSIAPGRRAQVELPLGRQVTGAALALPVIVVNGARPGPTAWVTAAVHGDEINGVEIIRRVVDTIDPDSMCGTLLALPVVNVPGFMTGSRYLPDRRDLNRSFPGSARGSLASRIAHLVMTEIVEGSDVGIDLHTGSDHRTNLPQIRGDLDDLQTREMADAFGAPMLVHAATRDGSLRQAAAERGCPVLLYEAGEAWRFDEDSIRIGTAGVLRVLAFTGVIVDDFDVPDPGPAPMISRGSRWARARRSGIAQLWVEPGAMVTKGQPIGRIHDAFGDALSDVKANETGLVVGAALDPIVNQGDALVHIARIESTDSPTDPSTDLRTEESER